MPEKDLVQRFSTAVRMTLVSKSWGLKGEDLGRFLRKNGISTAELESWREQMKNGLDTGKPLPRSEKKKLEERIAKLEKELSKANLLIDIQKKVQTLLAEDEALNTQKKLDAKSAKSSKKASKKASTKKTSARSSD